MLQGRVLTGDQREYVLAEWDGANGSGFEPLDDKVLVLMDEHAATTSGGVQLTDTYRERQSLAGETGVVVALGPGAFVWNDEATRSWSGRRPEAGDRVYCERYAGQLMQGADGRAYRLMSQRCIGAVQAIANANVPAPKPAAKRRNGKGKA